MALIPILPDDIRVSSVKVHPNQQFVSSSISGITGDVHLFAERSSTLKEITSELEEYTFDIRSLLAVDDSGNIVRKDQKRSRNDISGLIDGYFENVGKLAGSLDNDKKLIVYRFDMPHRFNSNTIRKSVFIKNLLPFYQGEYEKPLSYGFTNYHSLNFFTSSAAHPSNVPSDTASIYPVPTTGTDATGYKPSRYFPSGSFSFEFYINPRYTCDTSNDNYDAGTIMNMPNCYSISIVSGSHRDELGRPKSFRLMLQLGNNTAVPPHRIKLPINDAASGSVDDRTFISADGFLQKDRCSYCAIRWGGPSQNNYTGSFYINNEHAGNFTIPNTHLSMGRDFFSSAESSDIPSALLIGNRYAASIASQVDDDDLITVEDGLALAPKVKPAKASGKMTIKTTQAAAPNTVATRDIYFLTSSAAVSADSVMLNQSTASTIIDASQSALVTRLNSAIGGAAVDLTSTQGENANAVLVFADSIAAGEEITIRNAANVSRVYTSANDGSQSYTANPPTFKRGNSGSSAASRAAIVAQSLAEAINSAANGAGGGHGDTIKAASDGSRLTLEQATRGTNGNKNITVANPPITNATIPNAFAGGTNIENPALTGFSTQIVDNKIKLTYAAGRIDIIASSSIQVTPSQHTSGSEGNFLTDIFKISSQDPIFGNANSTASKTGFLFDSGSRNTYGVENLMGEISEDENVNHWLTSPLNAELQEIRIFSRWRTITEIESTSKSGYYNFDDKDFLFYLPPYFIPSSSVRQMLRTVTQTHFSSSHTPFNLDLSFGQGGRLINLENYSYDLVTGAQARCHNLTATPPTGTWSDFAADDFDFIPASEAITLKPQNRKRNLTVLPSDLGLLGPSLEKIDSRVLVLSKGATTSSFIDDNGHYAKGMVNLKDMISITSVEKSTSQHRPLGYGELSSFDSEDGNVDSITNRLFPPIEVARSRSGAGAGEFKEIAHAEVYGQQSKIGLTVLNRTRDPDSNEVMFLDISNIFYGDAIKQESFVMHDPYVTGSEGKVKLTFKDNGTGGLYRCDASGSHPTWSSAGIILYEEGLLCLTNPAIPPFGKKQFSVKFKGDRNLHVLEMRVPISSDEAKISSNPTYQKLAPTDLPSDREIGCNLITNMFIHDENLNVIGKVNLSRPIVRKDEDRYVFKFKMDF